MFVIILTKFGEFDVTLKPTSISVDFEEAMIKALDYHFKETSIDGCYFHFCQAIYRKMQSLGMSVPYQKNGEVFSFEYFKNLILEINYLIIFSFTDGVKKFLLYHSFH